MRDPDRAMEIYLRLLAERGEQAPLRASVAQQIADRIAKIGQVILTHLVADSRARAAAADKADGEARARPPAAANRPGGGLPFATDLFGELVRRHRPPPKRVAGAGPREGAAPPVMTRMDRRQRPAGEMLPAGKVRNSDPRLLRRRAGEEDLRAAQAADTGAKFSHQRLADLFWMAADQAEARQRGQNTR